MSLVCCQVIVTVGSRVVVMLLSCHQEAAGDGVTKEVFCRVCLPGDTTTVISPVAGQSLLTALVKVCERRKLCLAQYDVQYIDSDKVSEGGAGWMGNNPPGGCCFIAVIYTLHTVNFSHVQLYSVF